MRLQPTQMLWTVLMIAACGGEDGAVSDGERTGPCFSNGTCNAGLSCISDVCVDENESAAGGTSGGTSGSRSGGSSGGSSEGTSGGTEPEPECWSMTVANAYAPEKLNAAFCFGVAYSDDFGCTHDSLYDLTLCDDGSTGYYVTWTETSNGTRGDIYDQFDDTFLGTLRQDASGFFILDFADGDVGACSVVGDVLRLCLE